MKKLLTAILLLALQWTAGQAQGVKPLPSIHVDGRWLVDTHGNHVVLHGVMDTPSPYFNHQRWGKEANDQTVVACLKYFEKIFGALEERKCNVFRLHMDPAWTNDHTSGYTYKGSVGQADDATGEADISHFSEKKLKKYLKSVYVPIAKRAMNHGLFVVMRPPGVCPSTLKVGDYYQQYLLTVWDIATKNDSIRKYAGQISLELANEPVNVLNAEGQKDAKALHDYFQPIVDKMRANGFTGIIWVPGRGWQSNYEDYAQYPIEGYNIGYAVHDYTGWFNMSDKKYDEMKQAGTSPEDYYIKEFGRSVPVVNTNPIIITEVDWSPENPDAEGHYNEHGEWVQPNYGTWATGSTSKWGAAYKAMLDHFENVSMTLSSTGCLINVDSLWMKNKIVTAFNGMEEACAAACTKWYADYYYENWAHADFKNTVVSDLGNGKYQNPIIRADIPDPDVIRVGDTYYMVSTTMHLFPGATIVKSKDMVNWEYCAQPLTQLSTADKYSLLNGKNSYSQGMWACAMTWHNGRFYILINGNDAGGFILSTDNPEGKWGMKKLSRSYYDPGMIFDDGKVYIVSGNTEIHMNELDEDFNFKQEKVVWKSAQGGLEGSHLYKIGDYYYIYATYGGWPSGQTVFRSKNIWGPYEEKLLVEKTIDGKPNTIHQGSLIETVKGDWWTIMQQDLGALGRMPNLQPVKWQDGWPVVGNNGKPYDTYTKPVVDEAQPRTPLPTNDNFRQYPLGMQWQWNHNPDDGCWSLFERAGWLRLRPSGTAQSMLQARNTLTQRVFAFDKKASIGTIRMDVSHLKESGVAGIGLLQDPHAYIAVRVKDGKQQLVWREDTLKTVSNFTPREEVKAVTIDSIIYLRASIDYSTSLTQFYYSLDNKTWQKLGGQTKQSFNLSIFVGSRFSLFCYATAPSEDSYVDIDWFSTEDDYDELSYYPAEFEGYSQDMITAESITAPTEDLEVLNGGQGAALQLMVTFRDGHTENVAAKARYEISNPSAVAIEGGQARGLREGKASVKAFYTDPMGNELTATFSITSTFFPFSKSYINVALFGNGTYAESTRTFKPSQNGQMGWTYPSGADMSGYKYLVVNLKRAQNCSAHLNLFPTNSIWGDCYSSKQISGRQLVIDLQNAKLTDGDNKGKALDRKKIQIVSFWGNGNGTIVVSDMYLTNNDDYTREETTVVVDVRSKRENAQGAAFDLQGRKVTNSGWQNRNLTKGIYIINGRKVVVK